MRPSARVLTRRGWSLAGAGVGLAVAGRLLGAVELVVLAVGVAVLLGAAVLWARSRGLELAAHRSLRSPRLSVGDDGRVDLEVTNRSSRATPLLTASDMLDGTRHAARFLLPPLPPGETARAAYRVPTARRGCHRIGPLVVATSDPFGLARRSWVLSGTTDVLVWPRVHEILAPRQAGGRVMTSIETGRARALAADGDEFLTLRAYEMGDDLRRVHWRSTARTGELMIRRDEAQWRARAVVLLDSREEAHDHASFETAVEATASVVEQLVRMHRHVEVVSSAGHSLGIPSRGSARAVMDRLAMVQPERADRLAAVLSSLGTHRRAGFLVAVVGELGPTELEAFRALPGQGTVIVVTTRPSDEADHHWWPPGLVHVDASRVAFRSAWNQAVTRWHLAPQPHSPGSRSRP